MSNIAGPQEMDFAFREIALSERMVSDPDSLTNN